MYRIAICDDDNRFISYMETIIDRAKDGKAYPTQIYAFCSGEALIESLSVNIHYDLLILDMELGGIDGDETARLFREKRKDTVLVFCSGVRPPTVNSFKTAPFRYLLKSYSNDQFICEMKEILAEVERQSQEVYLIGHYRSNTIRVKIQHVLYVENAKRGSRVTVCKKCEKENFRGNILVTAKLENLSRQYPELVYAHSSYLINLQHVEKIIDNIAYLDSGEQLSVSRTYQKDFRTAFTKSIAQKY